jgi:hypothetical protein
VTITLNRPAVLTIVRPRLAKNLWGDLQISVAALGKTEGVVRVEVSQASSGTTTFPKYSLLVNLFSFVRAHQHRHAQAQSPHALGNHLALAGSHTHACNIPSLPQPPHASSASTETNGHPYL